MKASTTPDLKSCYEHFNGGHDRNFATPAAAPLDAGRWCADARDVRSGFVGPDPSCGRRSRPLARGHGRRVRRHRAPSQLDQPRARCRVPVPDPRDPASPEQPGRQDLQQPRGYAGADSRCGLTRRDARDRRRFDARREPPGRAGAAALGLLALLPEHPRASMRSIRAQALRTGSLGTPTLVVGAGVVGEHLVSRLLEHPGYGLNPVALLDASPLSGSGIPGPGAVPILDGSGGLLDAVQRTGARKVIVAFSSEPDGAWVKALEHCRRQGVEVALVPRMYELINERSTLDHVGGMPLVVLRPTDPLSWQFAVKHTIDRAVAAAALIALSPVLALIALSVKTTSAGPILFRQRRVGRDGHESTSLSSARWSTSPLRADLSLRAALHPEGSRGMTAARDLGKCSAAVRSTSFRN